MKHLPSLQQRITTGNLEARTEQGKKIDIEKGTILQQPFLKDDEVIFHRPSLMEQLRVPLSTWQTFTANQPFTSIGYMDVCFATWEDFLDHRTALMKLNVKAYHKHERQIASSSSLIDKNDPDFGIEKLMTDYDYVGTHKRRLDAGKSAHDGRVEIVVRLF
jgi:hypothetical protein